MSDGWRRGKAWHAWYGLQRVTGAIFRFFFSCFTFLNEFLSDRSRNKLDSQVCAVNGWGWCEVIFSSLVTQYNLLARTTARVWVSRGHLNFWIALAAPLKNDTCENPSFDLERPFTCTLHNTPALVTLIYCSPCCNDSSFLFGAHRAHSRGQCKSWLVCSFGYRSAADFAASVTDDCWGWDLWCRLWWCWFVDCSYWNVESHASSHLSTCCQ